jgi:hypothetical protein
MRRAILKNLSVILITMMMLASAKAQNPTSKAKASAPTPQAGSTSVTGSGTPARLSKWMGVSGTSSFVLGDSTISEDKFGNVGIGTDAPTAKLTVAGMIQTTLGGYKFPDGTVQTTAATSGLQSVFHDATLAGNGTQASPLTIGVPLNLIGSTTGPPLVRAENKGVSQNGFGGSGVGGVGAKSDSGVGGTGVVGQGGGSQFFVGGVGVAAVGGSGAMQGGKGLTALGGDAFEGDAGAAISATGGSALGGAGGIGLVAMGGVGELPGPSGDAIVAFAALGGFGSRAGSFYGGVEINGSLQVTGMKNFKIDHPLDPENKYLYHAAIESSEVLNVYSGNITTDENGDAVVALPDWFEAVNSDFRYQLTVVGTFAQAIVATKIKGNRFTIKTNAPNTEVSWQVTGVRSDAAMRKHPFKVEEDKPERERGSYLTPAAYNQPEERGVEWARDPQLMKQLKQQRLQPLPSPPSRRPSDR